MLSLTASSMRPRTWWDPWLSIMSSWGRTGPIFSRNTFLNQSDPKMPHIHTRSWYVHKKILGGGKSVAKDSTDFMVSPFTTHISGSFQPAALTHANIVAFSFELPVLPGAERAPVREMTEDGRDQTVFQSRRSSILCFGECHCWWTKEPPRALVAKFYGRLRLIHSVWEHQNFPCWKWLKL